MKTWFWSMCRTTVIIVFTIGLISNPAFGQKKGQERLDSLAAALPDMKEDSLKVKVLNGLAWDYSMIDTDKGILYGNESLVLCRKIGWRKGEGAALWVLGSNYEVQGNHREALKYFALTLKIAEERGNTKNIALTLKDMGISYTWLGEYSKALECLSRSIKISEDQGYEIILASALHSMGNIYIDLGDYAKTLDYYLRSLKTYERFSPDQAPAGTLSGIGSVYGYMEDYPKALEYFAKALKIHQETGNKQGIADDFLNTGLIYQELGKYDEALRHYSYAIKIYESIGDKSGIANITGDIGNIHNLQGDYGQAMPYLLKALKMYEELGEKEFIWLTLGDVGKCHLNQKNLAQAEKYYLAALKIAEELPSLIGIRDLSKDISELYSQKRDFKKALEFHKKFTTAKDSIQNEENIKKITRIEMQYEFDKKEDSTRTAHQLSEARSAALLTSETNLRRVYVASSLVLLLLLLLGGTFYQYRSQKKKMALISQVNEVEMKALRAQMNPHFMFNTLNSIYNFVRLNDNKSALDFLSRFSRLMRLTLENSMNPSITLKEELEALELYLMLESRRLDNKFNYVINVNGELETGGILVPPLLLQPYVENAIWHGMDNIETGGCIEISIEKEGELLKYTITDNGPGFSESHMGSLGNEKSYGSQLTQQRVQILNKTKKSNGYVRVNNRTDGSQSGVTVELAIPLERA